MEMFYSLVFRSIQWLGACSSPIPRTLCILLPHHMGLHSLTFIALSGSKRPYDPIWCSLEEPDLWCYPDSSDYNQGLYVPSSNCYPWFFLMLSLVAISVSLKYISKCFIHFSYKTHVPYCFIIKLPFFLFLNLAPNINMIPWT